MYILYIRVLCICIIIYECISKSFIFFIGRVCYSLYILNSIIIFITTTASTTTITCTCTTRTAAAISTINTHFYHRSIL